MDVLLLIVAPARSMWTNHRLHWTQSIVNCSVLLRVLPPFLLLLLFIEVARASLAKQQRDINPCVKTDQIQPKLGPT